MQMLALAAGDAAKLSLGINPALEQLLEATGLDLAVEPELQGGGAEPVRRPLLMVGVVIILGEVAGRRHGRTDGSDRQHG